MIYRRANPPASGERECYYHGIVAQKSKRESFLPEIGVVDHSKKGGKRIVCGLCRPTQHLAAKDADR